MVKVERKEFWKYFKGTYKSGKYLLTKYIASSILYIIISVISNLLKVKELTYLNAFIALAYFSTMISYGISGGILVFVNQNISSKDRVIKYVCKGFELDLIVSSICTTFLVLFPNFFMEQITGYVPDDYTFYYIMCVYFFINCVFEYLCNCIQNFELFKINMFLVNTPLLLMILSFLILYFVGYFYLNLIAIMYVVAYMAGLIFAVFCIMKNSKYKINIFKFVSLNFSTKQWKILVSIFLLEVTWQVGYYATSVALLRANDGIFNTYSYLEYVLDIFNGFLFTFTTITSIRITQALGMNKFDEAFKHAKYSLYATFIIWLFYAISSLVLIYPIALGVNDAYFNLMFTALPCYVLISLFRFFSWTFCSYMLKLGGKTTILIIIKIISSLYLISLCFFIQYLPQNVFLIYIMVSLNEIVPIPIYFYMFKSKKWMANVNEDPKLWSNKIKVFIFDFDYTLYYGVDWAFWINLNKNYFNEHYSYLTKKEKENLCKIVLGKKRIGNSEDLIKLLIYTEGSARSFLDFRNNLPFPEAKQKAKIVSQKELQKFRAQATEKGGEMFIVSNSTIHEIKEFCEYHKFDLSIFDEIIVNDYKDNNFSKALYFRYIMEKCNVKSDEILVIGDSKKHDILPAKKLGMNYYQCKDGFTYEEIIN